MKLILLGAPGAGKGTQAEILCDKLGIPTISTGNILRAAVKDGTPMGKKAKGFMDAGALVPDDVIVGIVKERLAEPDCAKGFILDGMPRTIAQGEALEQMGVEIDKVVNLIVPDEAITRRMSGRRVCAKCGASYHIVNKPSAKEGVCDRCGGELAIRKDDEPATVLDRLKAYHEQTEPLVEFYRQRGKLVEGSRPGFHRGHHRVPAQAFGGLKSMIQIKNAAELEKMRKACAISAAALKAGGEAIEPGITTAEIDKIIYDFIVRHGARPNFLHLYGFPATACISVNDTVIHGIPSRQQQIRPGDIVSIDTGCKIDGFNGDNACTYACGKIDLEAQRLLDVTKESLHRGIEMACGGNRVGDIGHAVQSYVEENGFSVVRTFVGHGVGKELHEDPEVPNFGNAGRGPRLVPGMCIAVEPMVCQYKYAVKTLKDGWTVKTCDGGLAAHFEHTMAITTAGAEVLTHGWEEPGWTL